MSLRSNGRLVWSSVCFSLSSVLAHNLASTIFDNETLHLHRYFWPEDLRPWPIAVLPSECALQALTVASSLLLQDPWLLIPERLNIASIGALTRPSVVLAVLILLTAWDWTSTTMIMPWWLRSFTSDVLGSLTLARSSNVFSYGFDHCWILSKSRRTRC